MTPQTILALMISFAQPGQSIYSQTVVRPESPPACSDATSLLCASPKPNPYWEGEHTRPETWDEGVERYWQIARLLHEVAEASTWQPVKGCPAPRVVRWQKTSERCKAAHKTRPWVGKADTLKRYMLTIAAHESGFRRDVQAGRGHRARGDCRDVNKPRTCRSTCLGQIMRTRRNWRSQRGYTWGSLTGLDDDSTRRCLETMADYLGTAKAVCTSPYGPAVYGPKCIYKIYGGVRSPNHPGIAARLRTHHRFGRPIKLEPRVLAMVMRP